MWVCPIHSSISLSANLPFNFSCCDLVLPHKLIKERYNNLFLELSEERKQSTKQLKTWKVNQFKLLPLTDCVVCWKLLLGIIIFYQIWNVHSPRINHSIKRRNWGRESEKNRNLILSAVCNDYKQEHVKYKTLIIFEWFFCQYWFRARWMKTFKLSAVLKSKLLLKAWTQNKKKGNFCCIGMLWNIFCYTFSFLILRLRHIYFSEVPTLDSICLLNIFSRSISTSRVNEESTLDIFYRERL